MNKPSGPRLRATPEPPPSNTHGGLYAPAARMTKHADTATIRIHGTQRPDDRSHRAAASIAIATAMVLTLAVLVLLTRGPAAGGTACPPPSAQLAALSGEPSNFTCTAVDETHFTTVAPVPVIEPLDVDIVQTPTGTTTQPIPAP